MQPTVQSEQDKMVPIDTSGDPVEIELKEEEKKEGEVQVEQEQPQVEVKEDKKEEELEEYSQSVKRRIDKLTKKMREAERQREEALAFARRIQDENKSLTSKVNSVSSVVITTSHSVVPSL